MSGFFGKLPALGDFLSRHVAEDFLEVWDAWLAAGIAASRTALAEEWDPIYMESPIWRFVFPAGYAGRLACAGVMMPSVDRVGRKFPLTLVAAFEQAPPSLLMMAACATYFSAAEDLALSALNIESFELEAFTDAVAALGPTLPVEMPGASVSPAAIAWIFELPIDDTLEVEIPQILGAPAVDELDGLALWWTLGSDRVPPCLLVSSSLPRGEGFTPFLNGNWTSGYWQQVALRTEAEQSHSADGVEANES